MSLSEKPMVGDLPAREVAAILAHFGERAAAEELAGLQSDEPLSELVKAGKWSPSPWQHTQFQCAYLAPGIESWYLRDARTIEADKTLIGASLKVTMDKLRIYDYPGSGIHQIFFDFSGKHQEADASDPAAVVHFSQNYLAQEGEGAGVSGYPVFNGLRVSKGGIDFVGKLTNVANQNDQNILKSLDSDAFTQGLNLIAPINPVLPVISGYAVTLLQSLLTRHENVKVHEFFLGLDFSNTATRAKLKEGSYVVAQAPDGAIDWDRWKWDPKAGMVRWWNGTGYLKFNYLVFGVSRISPDKS